MDQKKNGLLLVGNWDANEGYAWWLVESYWIAISRAYSQKYNIHLTYPTISKLPEAIANSEIQTHAFSFLPYKQGLVQSVHFNVWDHLKFIIKHRIKTIYFTDGETWTYRYLLYRLAGVRTIITHDHTPGVRPEPRGIRRVFKSLLKRVPFLTADVAIGATEYVRQRLIDVGCFPAHKTFSVPNGIPLNEYPPKDVYALFGISRNRKVLITAARATKYKGIDFALRALAATNSDEWHYIFCGDGPSLPEFKALAEELGITDQVTFAGKRSDVPELLASCYAAIHPSMGEVGYCLAILEFMKAGLPVIVPDNPSVSGLTDCETGIVYKTSTGASTAIMSLVENPKLTARLGKAAMERVIRGYTLNHAHGKLIDVFETCH